MRVGEVIHGPFSDLEWNIDIVGSPDESNRLADLVEFRFVTLIDDLDEDVAHDAVRSPVISGTVPLPGSLHAIVANQAHLRQSSNHPVREGRRRPAALGAA